MPPAPRKPHELRPVRKRGGAYVWWGRKWHHLGNWDARRNEPTAEAAERFDQLRALWRADPLAGSAPDSDALLIDVWADWLSSPERPAASRDLIDRVQRNLFGTAAAPGPHFASRVDAFDGRALLAWQSHLCGLRAPPPKGDPPRPGPTRRLLSRDSVARCVRMIRACLDWGLIQGVVNYEQAYGLGKVPPPSAGQVRENGKRKPVARAAVDPVLPLLSPPLRAAVELIWLACARPSEILGLRGEDILRAGSVTTPGGVVLDLDALGVWCAILGEHKTDGTDFERVLFFGPRSRRILESMGVGSESPGPIFKPADGVAHGRAVSLATRKPGGKGTRKAKAGVEQAVNGAYASHALARAVRRACVRAGLPVFTPYQLRHASFRLVQAQFGRDAARAFGGHRVGGATENYAGLDLKTAAKVAAAMG